MANWGGTDGRMDGRTEGRKDGRKDGRLKIPPCVLQDIGPLGPLPKKLGIGLRMINARVTVVAHVSRLVLTHSINVPAHVQVRLGYFKIHPLIHPSIS